MAPVVGLILSALAIFAPEVMGLAPGITGAAMFITSSVTWGGKETMDYFLRPMFIGKSPWETQGIRIIPNVVNTQNLNYFGSASKILKAYAKGFSAATGTTYTQRTLTVTKLKAEAADDASAFFDTVMEQALSKNDWNNLAESDRAVALDNAILSIYQNAVKSDIYRIFWLGDPYKETLSSTTYGNYSGTADANYNQLIGMWKLIFDNAATSPSDTQIKRVAISDGAVAQVHTLEATGGSSGNLIITVNGVDYTTAYGTSLDATMLAWVTAHGAALALRGITVADGGTAITTFTSAIPGQPFAAPAFKGTSDITGTVTATTANTAPSALSAGESEDAFLSLFENCDVVLKNIPAAEKVFLVDRLVYENYQTYLETLSTVTANTKLENGVSMLTYRGIPVLPMEWSTYLNTDFPHASTYLPAYPHRIIYTQIYNLALGFDVMNQFTATRRWYNEDEEENRFRMKLKMGAQFVHNKLMAVAY